MGIFDSLVVGDKVIVVDCGFGSPRRTVQRVAKVTNTTFSTFSGTFSKKSSKKHGSSDWHPTFAEEATPENLAVLAANKAAEAIRARVKNAKAALAAIEVDPDNLEVIEALLHGLVWGK